MKTSFLTRVAILLVPCACSRGTGIPELVEDPEIPGLVVEREFSRRVLNSDDEIQIMSGSGDYSVHVENEEIVSAGILHPGKITISGIKIGVTCVTVRDDNSLQEKQIQATITVGNARVASSNAHVTLEILDRHVSTNMYHPEFLSGLSRDLLFNARYITLVPGAEKVYIFRDNRSFRNGDYFHEGTYHLNERQENDATTMDIIVGGQGYSYFLEGQSHKNLYTDLNTPALAPYPTPFMVYLRHDLTASYGHLFPDEDELYITFTTICRNAFHLKAPERVFP
jgi:hypothetical protein